MSICRIRSRGRRQAQDLLPEVLCYEEFLDIVDSVTGVARQHTIEVLAERAPKPRTVNQLLTIVEPGNLRLKSIQVLSGSLANRLSFDDYRRLVTLVPKPSVSLTRFHGLFPPNRMYRTRVTPAKQEEAERLQLAATSTGQCNTQALK